MNILSSTNQASILPQENVKLLANQWQALAGTVASLSSPDGHIKSRVRLHISFGVLSQDAKLWGARFWEADDPHNVNRVDWLLISKQPVRCVEDAVQLLLSRSGLVTGLYCR